MKTIEIIARDQSNFDGRPWDSMHSIDRNRYLDRAKIALESMKIIIKNIPNGDGTHDTLFCKYIDKVLENESKL